MSVSAPLAAIPSFDNNGVDPTQASLNRLQQVVDLLDNTLRLPNNPRTFAIYVLGLLIVFAGAFMHVLIAAQIMQAEFTLSQLQEEYRAIEQQNGDIIFQIARDTNMARLQERVVAQGYMPVQEREYIFVPSETVAAAATLAANGPQANAPTPDSAQATQPAQAVVATTEPKTGIGQFARWEEFWNMTWRSATGGSVAATTPGITAAAAASNTQASKAAPDFWSLWWEEATERGSKLLEEFRSQ